MIVDNHGRPIHYLRLSVTDRCNLRCLYCMPENGIDVLPNQELLTFEEMIRIVNLFTSLGIYKVRITGGEPFTRKGIVDFLSHIGTISGLNELHLTTNGLWSAEHVPVLKSIGVKGVNLSVDTLDPVRFKKITRRDELHKVKDTLRLLLDYEIPVKLNAVIMNGLNDMDILPLAELTKESSIDVRFIEEMPFNGVGRYEPMLVWDYKKILKVLQDAYPELMRMDEKPFSTAMTYQVPGYKGTLGVIAAYSRTFCGTCNRIRITANGTLKTCLYDEGVYDVKSAMRNGLSDQELTEQLLVLFRHRPKNGFEAEASRKENTSITESMSTIGG